MIWFWYGLLLAFTQSLHDLLTKQALKKLDRLTLTLGVSFCVILFLSPLLFFIEIPNLNQVFWIALFTDSILNVVAVLLFVKALQKGELSNTIPMLAFTPLFLLVTSHTINKEFPPLLGLAGVVLIVLGSYILNITEMHKGMLAPFKAFWQSKGPKEMLGVAFIWSITASIDKVGVLESSPAFWSIAVSAMIFFFLALISIFTKQFACSKIHHWKSMLFIGFLVSIAMMIQMSLLQMTLVSYVIALKRLSIVFGVLFGCWFFKEKGIKERLAGASVMAVGAMCIVLA